MDISTWQVYVLIAVVLMISEIFLPGLILLPIGIGFLISAVFAGFITNKALLYLLTAVCVGAVFLTFKKFFNKVDPNESKTAVDAMAGKLVTVLEEVSSTKEGYVKLYGDTWKALAVESGETFSKGDTAVIVKVEGNKVFIVAGS